MLSSALKLRRNKKLLRRDFVKKMRTPCLWHYTEDIACPTFFVHRSTVGVFKNITPIQRQRTVGGEVHIGSASGILHLIWDDKVARTQTCILCAAFWFVSRHTTKAWSLRGQCYPCTHYCSARRHLRVSSQRNAIKWRSCWRHEPAAELTSRTCKSAD